MKEGGPEIPQLKDFQLPAPGASLLATLAGLAGRGMERLEFRAVQPGRAYRKPGIADLPDA